MGGFDLFLEELESLVRDPYDTEVDFFRKNPEVGGMASEDGRIVLNPFRQFSDDERKSLLINEASRIMFKKHPRSMDFPITGEQAGFFSGLQRRGVPSETSGQDIRETILSRLLSGDPSAGRPTPLQVRESSRVGSELMRFLRRQR